VGYDADEFLRGLFTAPAVAELVPDATKGNDAAAITPDDLPDNWRERYEERAAIAEYDGGLTREQAEAQALGDVVRMIESVDESNPGERENA